MDHRKPQVTRLAGDGRFTRLLSGVPTTAGMKSGYVILRPGEAVGQHTTDAREEAIIILEGKASVYCEEALFFVAEAESVVYIPPETRHDIKNEGSTTLRYVYVVAPVDLVK